MLKTLRKLPLREWQLAKAWFRKRYATHPWPSWRASVFVEADLQTAERQFRRVHYEDASGWSLYYQGEVLNLRRPVGRSEAGIPEEDHIRARETDTGLEFLAHREPNRWEAKVEHVNEIGLYWFDEDELAILISETITPDK